MEKPAIKGYLESLNVEQFKIGRLPWIEVTKNGASPAALGIEALDDSFARLDLTLIPQDKQVELQALMKRNGIEAAFTPSLTDGHTYLEVPLKSKSGEILDKVRMGATQWKEYESPTHGNIMRNVVNELHSKEFLKQNIEAGGQTNPDLVNHGLANVFRRNGLTDTKVITGSDEIQKLQIPVESNPKLQKILQNGVIETNAGTSGESLVSRMSRFFKGGSLLNASQVALLPMAVAADYKEAGALAKTFVEGHKLTQEAADDYAAAIAQTKLVNNATFNVDPSLGAKYYVEWIEKHHISKDIYTALDTADVTKHIIDNRLELEI
ncbi:MAG: hypothetical protein PHO76_12920 [Methylotenera sp.]|nr:hypothetical protein [Methylotenera sp.]MDD4926678.1 hypothetical protein [Methylotenera sp.]